MRGGGNVNYLGYSNRCAMCVYQDMVLFSLTIFINTMNGFNKPFNKPSRDVVNIVDSAPAMEEGAQSRREEMLV